MLALAGLLSLACGGDSATGPGAIASVRVTPGVVDTLIGVGGTVQLTATARDSHDRLVPGGVFTWSSSDPAVAVVTDGLVTAKSNGTATITATEASGFVGATTFTSATLVASLTDTLTYAVAPNSTHHAMGLTFDGTNYFVINDGTQPSPLSRISPTTGFIGTVDVPEDARGILYSGRDGKLYMKNFGTTLYSVDPATGDTTTALTNIYVDQQSSPAMSTDGLFLYELASGQVRVINAVSGLPTDSLPGIPGTTAIAADGRFLYTWSPPTVYVHDLSGRLVTTFTVPTGLWSYSLSYANGRLWTADDLISSDSVGVWYGYTLTKQ